MLCASAYTAYDVNMVHTYKNKCYLIPFKSQKCMSFRLVPPKSNQKKFIRFAQDYFIGNII